MEVIIAQLISCFPKNLEADGCVYLVRLKHDKSLLKIGTSKDVKCRIQTLQTGNPRSLEIWAQFKCDNYKKLENMLHSLFTSFKVRGEWFRLPQIILTLLTKYFDVQIAIEAENFVEIENEMEKLEREAFVQFEDRYVSSFNTLLLQSKHFLDEANMTAFYRRLTQCGSIMKYYSGSNLSVEEYEYAEIHHPQILNYSLLLQSYFNIDDLLNRNFWTVNKTYYIEIFAKLPFLQMQKISEVFKLFNKNLKDFGTFLPIQIFAENETNIVDLMTNSTATQICQPEKKKRKLIPGAMAVSAFKRQLKQIWGTNLVMERSQIKRKAYVTGYRYVKVDLVHNLALKSHFISYLQEYHTSHSSM